MRRAVFKVGINFFFKGYETPDRKTMGRLNQIKHLNSFLSLQFVANNIAT